jgi:hypothetical protein
MVECISYNSSYSVISLTFLWHVVLSEEVLIPVCQQDVILLLKPVCRLESSNYTTRLFLFGKQQICWDFPDCIQGIT